MPKWLAGHRTGHLRSVEYDTAIDDHRRKSIWILMRLFKGRLVTDFRFIEDHDICGKAFTDLATIAKSKRLSGKRRHFSNSIFERDYFQLANVMPEHPSVVAIPARVRYT